jgi:hypothetical protein
MAAPWPEEMIAAARRLWEIEGCTASQVALALARDHRFPTSRSAICGLAHRQGWASRKAAVSHEPKPKKARVARVSVAVPRPMPMLKIVPPAPPPPEPISAPADRAGVGFFDIRDGLCRWPLWGLATPFSEKRFCGEPTPAVEPYCAYCRTLSYEPTRSAA